MTVLAAVAQFERGLISERIKFGRRFGEANGHGRARELMPDPEEQAAIAEIVRLRADGRSLMAIRNAMRAQGFPISHQLVANTVARHAAGGTA
jgi:DNA invertase Pin-like site-specific DNA recombinase